MPQTQSIQTALSQPGVSPAAQQSAGVQGQLPAHSSGLTARSVQGWSQTAVQHAESMAQTQSVQMALLQPGVSLARQHSPEQAQLPLHSSAALETQYSSQISEQQFESSSQTQAWQALTSQPGAPWEAQHSPPGVGLGVGVAGVPVAVGVGTVAQAQFAAHALLAAATQSASQTPAQHTS